VHQRLGERFDLDVIDPTSQDARSLAVALSDADALIGSGLAISASVLDDAPNLRAIASIAAGYDAFDIADLARRGITLMNTPGLMADATADLALALMLAAARKLVPLSLLVSSGQWTSRVGVESFGVDVTGATLGIVGMGDVGRAVAERAVGGFRMRLLYASRSRKPEVEEALGGAWAPLPDLLRRSDIVCLCVALTPETKDLIGAAQLALMKPTSVLVNVARGEVLDETALARALDAGRLFGAGLDVHRREPLGTETLFGVDTNVVSLPHIGSATPQTRLAMAECAADNLIGFFDGAPRNVVAVPGAVVRSTPDLTRTCD
jgi:gluconate 2-dehydrogenase